MSTVVKLGGEGRVLKLSVGTTVQNNTIKRTTFEWSALKEKLGTTHRTHESIAEYLGLPREKQDQIKDVGYFVPGHYKGKVRKKNDLEFRECLTLDIDFAPANWRDRLFDAYGEFAFICHTTHKHTEEKPRLRLVFPIVEPLNEIEYEAVGRMVASWFGINAFDDTTYQFGRVMHFPSTAKDGVFEVIDSEAHGKKPWLSKAVALNEYLDWTDVTEWPLSVREKRTPHIALEKAEDPLKKKGVVGAFCRAYSIREAVAQFLPKIYKPGNGPDRFTYIPGSTSNGVVCYEGKWIYSHHGTDPCHLTLLNAFDMVRLHLFGHLDEGSPADTVVSKLKSFDAMSELVTDDAKAGLELAKSQIRVTADAFDEIFDYDAKPVDDDDFATAGENEFGEEPEDKSDLWLGKLALTEKGVFKRSFENLVLIFQNDKLLKGTFGFNEFTRRIVLLRPISKHKVIDTVNGTTVGDRDVILVKSYIAKKYDLEFATSLIEEALYVVIEANQFHPVKNYLESLEWDGVSRVDTLMIKYAGAEDTEYVRSVTRLTLLACVARIYHPGVKFDTMLSLEGAQGAGKSSLFRALAVRDEWFDDTVTLGMDDKMLVERTSGKWFIEVQEMVARTAAETQHIKAFITRQTENVRMAYAHFGDEYPRQFVLFGTVNETEWLFDETGNRRWWPLAVGAEIDLKGVRAIVPQIWAELKAAYDAINSQSGGDIAEALKLPRALWQAAGEEQARRMVSDEWEGVISEYLNNLPRDLDQFEFDDLDDEFATGSQVDRSAVCVMEIWENVLNGDREKLDRKISRRISRILTGRLQCIKGSAHRFGKRFGVQKAFYLPRN